MLAALIEWSEAEWFDTLMLIAMILFIVAAIPRADAKLNGKALPIGLAVAAFAWVLL